MKSKLFTLLFLLIYCASVTAQDFVFPELKGYKRNVDFPVYRPDNLWDFINGAAETYLSYGFVDLHVAEYKKGKNIIKVQLYRHQDNILAFGIYSIERSPSFRFMKLGSQGYNTGGAINFFKGNYYVKIRTYSKNEKTLQAAENLALTVANLLDGNNKMPAVLSDFPDSGRKINEEAYINESVMGHKFLNKAFKAEYEVGPDKFTIYIIDNDSLEQTLKTAETYLLSTGIDALDSGSGKYMLSDGYNGTVFLAWRGNRIIIISGLSKDQADVADKYTSEILR